MATRCATGREGSGMIAAPAGVKVPGGSLQTGPTPIFAPAPRVRLAQSLPSARLPGLRKTPQQEVIATEINRCLHAAPHGPLLIAAYRARVLHLLDNQIAQRGHVPNPTAKAPHS
jgi:hypothetical protein